jgi:4-amino-4-deoxy-L-arabinose transferase-like glycosyltransferase
MVTGRLMPRFKLWLAAIVVVALVVRLAVVIATPHYQARTDAADFDRLAVSLADHGHYPDSHEWAPAGPTAFRPPLFPAALAAVYKVVGTGSAHARWTAGRILQAVLGAIVTVLTALIAVRLWGPATGLLAGGLVALDPPLVLIGSSLLSESLFIPLVLAAVLAALIFRTDRRLRWAVLSGVLVGCAALTRGNGFVLVIPLAFLVWNERPRRRALRAPALVLAAAVLTVVPWTIRNYAAFHRFVPLTTEGGYALAGTYNEATQHRPGFEAVWYPPLDQMHSLFAAHPRINEAQASARLQSDGLHYIEHHPSSLLKTAYLSARRLLNLESPILEEVFAYGEGYPVRLAQYSVYTFWVVLALAIVGALTRAARRPPAAFWWCPALMLASTVFFEGLTRYRSPADPFFVMLAALALVAGARRLRRPAVPAAPPPGERVAVGR